MRTHIFWCLIVLFAGSSCVSHQQLISLRGEDEEPLKDYLKKIDLPTLTVQPDDILYITVNSLNDETSRPYNLAQSAGGGNSGGGGSGSNLLLLQGYSVDSTGYIDFPSIGRIQVGGLSLEGVRSVVVDALQPFLLDPAVNVKFLNFRYSIIGDVNAPGTFSTVNERVTLLEALATAGDLTPYANRERVVIIRELDGVRTATTLNLKGAEFLSSPYYYLQQNDVIYIEPTQAKVATVADPISRFISYGSAFLSLITLSLTLLTR